MSETTPKALFAFHPWYPAVPAPFLAADLAGRVEQRFAHAIGGSAMIDHFAISLFADIVSGMNAFGEIPDDTAREAARNAWRLARIVVEERPEMPRPEKVNGPKLLEG